MENKGFNLNYFLAKITCFFSDLIRLFTFGSYSNLSSVNYCVL